MEERELKALEIAAKSKLTRKGKTWLVPSQSVRGAQYTVKPDPHEPQCNCPDFECRKQRCKHIFAVEYTIEREHTPDGETVITESFKVTRKTYSQDWPAYNTAPAGTTISVLIAEEDPKRRLLGRTATHSSGLTKNGDSSKTSTGKGANSHTPNLNRITP